jgi:heme-degrading monooxygenase HmoA
VLFSVERTDDGRDYVETDEALTELVVQQPGFLGVESLDDGRFGITISYWATEDDATAWKKVAEHRAAQQLARDRWYTGYRVRVAKVEREYGFEL